ncbi:MAG TPA: VOC family protein [Dongiaceae bacterium]
MQVQPYLFFDGRCEEALELYKRVLGAKVQMLMRFKEAPDQSMVKPGSGNKVMHSEVQIGSSTFLASDGHCAGKPSFEGFSLSVDAPNDAEAKRMFTALAEGGQVRMPMDKTFFASSFGMCADKFGVGWMVIVPLPHNH